MRAGTLVPATPGVGAFLPVGIVERSMRAGTLVPATPEELGIYPPGSSTLNEGRNFSSGNTIADMSAINATSGAQ